MDSLSLSWSILSKFVPNDSSFVVVVNFFSETFPFSIYMVHMFYFFFLDSGSSLNRQLFFPFNICVCRILLYIYIYMASWPIFITQCYYNFCFFSTMMMKIIIFFLRETIIYSGYPFLLGRNIHEYHIHTHKYIIHLCPLFIIII